MSKIKIKNFGPIKAGYLENDGWMDIKKVTVFIGNQGSGKSTVAKLISTFTWIEKVLVRGDYNTKWFEEKDRFKNQYLAYHRIENFLKENTEIQYEGDAYHFKFEKEELLITKKSETGEYVLPQIMYVPAERNFIANVKASKIVKLTSGALFEFGLEFENALQMMNREIYFPINNIRLQYDLFSGIIYVKGDDYKIELSEASSGIQSFTPLFLVTRHLNSLIFPHKADYPEPKLNSIDEMLRFRKSADEILHNPDLTDEQRRASLSTLSFKFNKKAFINIVEEPEQNLFPSSQGKMLWDLLRFNNSWDEERQQVNKNKLIMTTHSPYIINFLSIAIQGGYLIRKIRLQDLIEKRSLDSQLNNIIPINSTVNAEDVAIYELDEKTGSIKKLPNFEGIPSDNNFLNNSLAEGNKLFDSLLEIEEEL